MADLLGTNVDDELGCDIHWAWCWLLLGLSQCLGGGRVFGSSTKAGSVSVLLRIAQAAIPTLRPQAAYHRVSIYPPSQGGSPSPFQQPCNVEKIKLLVVSVFRNYEA